ncbi:MAG: hypothetical protein IRY99_12245 [Isosphaeraceae bacterium]|nr:hypothetical protein [Isosphaeraceae bacterium]
MMIGPWRALASSLALAALLPILILASGCGRSTPERPETVPLSGKVTYKGQPIPKGTVTFQADSGPVATGQIQPDGTYRMTTFEPGDGVVLGHHRVAIIANTEDPTLMPGSSPGYRAPKDLIPASYGDPRTSNLEANVQKDTRNLDFNLP